MVYLNIEKIKNIKRETILPILRVVVILALAGAVLAIVLLQGKQGDEDIAREKGQKLTEEEKIKILESLSAPADAPQYTNEEKRQILESLSAPQEPTLTEEEKKAILESLSAPNQ